MARIPSLSFPRSLSAWAFLLGLALPLSLAVSNMAWVAFAITWAASLWVRRTKPAFTPTPIDKPIIAVLFVALVASLMGLAPTASLCQFPKELRVVVFYLLIWAEGGRYAPIVLRGYLAGAIVAMVYGLGQALLWNVIHPQPYVHGFPGWFDALSPTIQRYVMLHGAPSPDALFRIHGAMHPLTYAEILLPAFLLFTVLFLDRTDRSARWKYGLAAAGIGTALLLSQSRGPWLGALAGLLVVAVFHKKRLWLAALFLILGLVVMGHPVTRERLFSLMTPAQDQSARIRLNLWRSGLYFARQHPVHGVGPGQIAQARQHHKDDSALPSCPSRFAGDLHNLYLQQLATRGIPGLMALLWLLAIPLIEAFRLTRQRSSLSPPKRSLVLALSAFYAAFLVLNFTERAFEDAEVSLLFWLLTAQLWAPQRETH